MRRRTPLRWMLRPSKPDGTERAPPCWPGHHRPGGIVGWVGTELQITLLAKLGCWASGCLKADIAPFSQCCAAQQRVTEKSQFKIPFLFNRLRAILSFSYF